MTPLIRMGSAAVAAAVLAVAASAAPRGPAQPGPVDGRVRAVRFDRRTR